MLDCADCLISAASVADAIDKGFAYMQHELRTTAGSAAACAIAEVTEIADPM